MLEKRFLQLAIALGGFVPVLAGADGVLRGAAMAGGAHGGDLDSHVHYLSGLLLGLGLLFWSCIPAVERKTSMVRVLTIMVVIGGLARAYAAFRYGLPGQGMRLGLGMELVVTPLLCAWQGRVAAREDNRGRADAPPLAVAMQR